VRVGLPLDLVLDDLQRVIERPAAQPRGGRPGNASPAMPRPFTSTCARADEAGAGTLRPCRSSTSTA